VLVGKRAPTRLERVRTQDRGKALSLAARTCLELTPWYADAALRDKTIVATSGAIDWLMANGLPGARATARTAIRLDLDATDEPLHGHQCGTQQADGAFAVDQAGDIAASISLSGLTLRQFATDILNTKRKRALECTPRPADWWRRRDSDSPPFGEAWTMPSSGSDTTRWGPDAGRVIRVAADPSGRSAVAGSASL
jgi:hypothetical protein